MDNQTERMYQIMRKETNRLKTFQMSPPWPKDYVDIKKLAKAGFFYAFNGDNVHCAFCRGQVCRWDRDDDPMVEHARHFTTCPFIMGGEVGNEPIGEDPIPGPKRPRPFDVCGPHANFPPSDPRSSQEQQAHELEEREEENLPQQQQNQSYQQNPSLQTEVRPNPEASQNQMQPHRSSQIQPCLQSQSELYDSRIRRNQLLYQEMLSQRYAAYHQRLSNHDSSTYSNRNNSSEPNNGNNNLSGICKICYTNPIELVFLPCGHSVSCLLCAERLHDCPFCRENITTRIRTYLV